MEKPVKSYSVIGSRQPRLDARVKVTGEAKYVDDLTLPRMLFGKVLRSPHPHARIRNIDTSVAERLSGVKAVITGKDTLGIKWGRMPGSRDRQAIPTDKVRFIGEGVAAVAATDLDTAEEALELIKVDYEPLHAVFDAEDAMKEGASLVHEGVKQNIALYRKWDLGDAEKGFRESDHIQENKFTSGVQMHGFLEPPGYLANYDSQGRLTIWTGTMIPYLARTAISAFLNIPYDKVRIINQHVGGSFGGKGDYWDGSVGAALLSIKTGRPVKIIFTKDEEFVANTRRLPKVLHLKTGVRKDGTLMVQELRAITNGGAYLDVGSITIYNIALALMLPYRIPNFRYEAFRVYTNNPVCGPQRGHGQNESRYAAETQLDMIAEELGLDPVELRLKNALQPGEVTINKMRITTCGLSEAIQKTAASSGWKEKRGKRRQMGLGIGMGTSGFASGIRLGALSDSGVVIKVNEDATITILAGDADVGQGSDTMMAMVVAEVLGITVNDISVISADTSTCPFAPGTFGSRVTFYGGNAARLAAEDVKKQLTQVVARNLGASPDDLTFKDKAVWVKGEKKVTFAEAVRMSEISSLLGGQGVIIGKGSYSPPNIEFPDKRTQEGNIAGSYSFAAQVAEVEVNKETGKVKLLKMTLGDDCGQPINALACEGQIHGCIHMGQGQALYEEVLMSKGEVLNPNLRDYKMPTAMDTPEMDVIHAITDDPIGPFGAKEIGEGFIVSTPASIGNAIHNATGVWITDLPITPEKIVQALKEKEKKEYRLTATEVETLTWLAEGKTSKEIALLRGLKHQTIKNQLQKIYKKMGACNRANAVWLSKDRGLI